MYGKKAVPGDLIARVSLVGLSLSVTQGHVKRVTKMPNPLRTLHTLKMDVVEDGYSVTIFSD